LAPTVGIVMTGFRYLGEILIFFIINDGSTLDLLAGSIFVYGGQIAAEA
jgi:hypothetical protein